VSYAQVFGRDEDSDLFAFEFKETDRYFIDDQYCANPECICNEAILVFCKIDQGKEFTVDSEQLKPFFIPVFACSLLNQILADKSNRESCYL
jgi:hypothetical protein